MHVALFGGSFNPTHVAHQLAALYVLETEAVDELWLVPAFQHPFDKPLTAFADRFRMCQLAAEALGPRVRVSDIEAQLGGPSRTLRTVRRLIDDNPQTSFSLVIGSDLVAETGTWFGSAELRSLVRFIVVERGGPEGGGVAGAAPPTEAAAGPRTTDPTAASRGPRAVMPAVSSTDIRAALADGRDVRGLVPRSVLDYIASRGLYRRTQPAPSTD